MCTSRVLVRPEHAQQAGLVHAGLTTTIADHTAGAAAGSLMGPDEQVVSVEFVVHLLRPATGIALTCRAEVVKPGRMLTVVQADVYTGANGDAPAPTHVARMLATMAYIAT